MTFSEFGRRPEENGDGWHRPRHGRAAVRDRRPRERRPARRAAEPHATRRRRQPRADRRLPFGVRHVLRDWLKADDKQLLGKTYPDLSLFRSGPAAPFTGSESGYWLAGPTAAVHGFGRGTKFGSIAHARAPDRRGRRDADAHRDVAGDRDRWRALLRRRQAARLGRAATSSSRSSGWPRRLRARATGW
jgi:hypothetical protein